MLECQPGNSCDRCMSAHVKLTVLANTGIVPCLGFSCCKISRANAPCVTQIYAAFQRAPSFTPRCSLNMALADLMQSLQL